MKGQTMDVCSATPATTTSPEKHGVVVRCNGEGKRLHETIYEAIRHILQMSQRGTKEFGSYYYCKACRGYHVTSRPPNGTFRKL